MNRSDFYNDKRKERKVNFLADYRVVRKYLCRKYGLKQAQFEFLCKLHSLGTFLKADFEGAEGIIPWQCDRWAVMLGDTIVVHRERKPSEGRNYKIYTISDDAKYIIEECYRILCGEKSIPETARYNPIMREDSYSDKKYAEAIRMFNRARQNK